MWKHGFTGSPGLEKLGIAVIRLSRLVLYHKLQCGQAQLRAIGIENEIGDSFKAQSLKEITKERLAPKDKKVRIVVSPRSTF